MNIAIIRLFLLIVLFLTEISYAEIYKWVDDEGNVHFGDTPAVEHKTKQIEISPRPSEEDILRAKQRAEHLIQKQKHRMGTDNLEEVRGHKKGIKPSDVVNDWNPTCFTNSVELLGEGKVDPFEEVQPITVTRQDLNTLQSMLQRLKGGWHGKMEEVRCLGTKDSPNTTTRHYEIQAKIYWGDGLLEIMSDMVRHDDMERHRRIDTWLLFQEGPDSRGARHSDTSIWVVEAVSIEPSSLIFVRKHRVRSAYGASVHRLDLRSFKVTKNTLTIRELFYSQDILDNMKTWVLKR